MLLYSKRPSVHPNIWPVILNVEHLAEIPPPTSSRAENLAHSERNREEEVKRGVKLEAAPEVKSGHVDGAAFLIFDKQQSGNQEPAKDKE